MQERRWVGVKVGVTMRATAFAVLKKRLRKRLFLVSLRLASWNQIDDWLTGLDALRRAA